MRETNEVRIAATLQRDGALFTEYSEPQAQVVSLVLNELWTATSLIAKENHTKKY